MHLLWIAGIMGISVLHFHFSQCNDLNMLSVGLPSNSKQENIGRNGGSAHLNANTNIGLNANDLVGGGAKNVNSSTILGGESFNSGGGGGGTFNKGISSNNGFGDSITGGGSSAHHGMDISSDRNNGKIVGGDATAVGLPGMSSNGQDGVSSSSSSSIGGSSASSYKGHNKHMKVYGGQQQYGQQQYGHALAGLANLGIILPPTSKGTNVEDYSYSRGRMIQSKFDSDTNVKDTTDISGGGQSAYQEHFISEHTVMAVFTSQGQVGGPCLYMPATRRQNHQCRKEYGLPSAIFEARRLATTHCENQFRYDRWNCSIETRGKRNIFKKLYKETAFVHALTAAALSHTIARACAEGRMTKCICGPRKQNMIGQDFQWGGCNDNLKHGKRVTRSFLNLRDTDGDDEVSEILRHDSEVGIEAVSTLMKDKCKCHGVSGSCSMKTCWKKLSEFNATSTLLRQKYNEAIRKAPNARTIRRDIVLPTNRLKRLKQRRKKQSQYTTLYYLETSPTYCSVTKDRQCLHPDNCATLCCGRGYTTHVFKQVEKCRCRFNNGRCCQLICDYCQRFEDKYFCK